MYIVNANVITPIGADLEMTYHAFQANMDRYQSSNIFNTRLKPYKAASIPCQILPKVDDVCDACPEFSQWKKRLMSMACEALNGLSLDNITTPIPLILVGPSLHYARGSVLPENFIHLLQSITNLPIDVGASRLVASGRAGAIAAIDLADEYFNKAKGDYVLIGGVDSLLRPEILALFDHQERLLCEENSDGFVPGEAAGFFLLASDKAKSTSNFQHIIDVGAVGVAQEEGNLLAHDKPYTGEGLSSAVKKACAGSGPIQFDKYFSSMNGEHYWSKELGVSLARNNKYFKIELDIVHPSDCYGDLGAATGSVLVAMAFHDLLHTTQGSKSHLIACSNDDALRAAVSLSVQG